MLKILVVGAGAIGCFVGGRLAGAGHNVTLVGRPRLMDKIAADGLILQHPTDPPQIVRPETVTMLAAAPNPADFILIAVKAPDTPQIIRELNQAGFMQHNGHFVSLQNGIGNEELLAEAFGAERIIAGTITIPISVPEQGVISISKDKGGLGVAGLQPDQPVALLAEALNGAGLTTPTYPDYKAMKWSKLLLNIINNASSAILDQAPGQIIANPELFNMEIAALNEGLDVMRVEGIAAVRLPGYPVDWLARLVSARWLPLALKRTILRPFMVSGRGTKMPSLHIDLAAGKPTSEVGVLNGAIVAAGQQVGIATPVNTVLTSILEQLVTRQLPRDAFAGQQEKLLKLVKHETDSVSRSKT